MLVRQFVLQLNAGANVNPVIHTNQYDEGELWCFTLLSGTQVVQPEESAMIGLASDGKTYDVNGYVDELGRACITETTEITSSPGQGEYELQVGGHGTANFYVQVEARPTDGTVISDDEYAYFDEVVQQTSQNAQVAQESAQSVSGYVDFSTRTQKDEPDLTDIFAMQSATGEPLKIDYDKLAQAIIEKYSDSAIGDSVSGAISTIKSLLNTARNYATVSQTYVTEGGIRYFVIGNLLFLHVYDMRFSDATTSSVTNSYHQYSIATGFPVNDISTTFLLKSWTDTRTVRVALWQGVLYFHYSQSIEHTGTEQFYGFAFARIA